MIGQSYLVVANSNSEHDNADCDLALLTFTPELLRKLARLKTAFLKQKRRFRELGSWNLSDGAATFISRKAAEAFLGTEAFEAMDSESGGDPFLVPSGVKIDLEKFDATDADEMVLSAEGVWWRAFPRHSEISVGSEFLQWKWFTQCAYCGLRRQEHAKGKCLFTSTSYKASAPGLDGKLQTRRRRSTKR